MTHVILSWLEGRYIWRSLDVSDVVESGVQSRSNFKIGIYTISNGPLHYMHIVKYISTIYYYHNLGFDPSLQFQLEPGCRHQSSIRHTLNRIWRRQNIVLIKIIIVLIITIIIIIIGNEKCDLHGIEVSFGFPVTFLLRPSPPFHLENVTFNLVF